MAYSLIGEGSLKIFKKVGIIAIVLFSFYYTEEIANFVLHSNPLYKEIDNKKESYEILSVAAKIDGDYIIPGLNGVGVNVKDSYYNMKSLEVFNEYYLKYMNTYPEVSIIQNKDKIINKGNPNKNSVSLVLEYDENIIEALKNNHFSVLVSFDQFDKNANYECINNEVSNFDKLENLINKYKNNTGICVLSNGNERVCRDKKMFLVKPEKILSDSTILSLKDTVESGDIILIKKNTKVSNVLLLLKSIKYKDYKINYLSEHISEERN